MLCKNSKDVTFHIINVFNCSLYMISLFTGPFFPRLVQHYVRWGWGHIHISPSRCWCWQGWYADPHIKLRYTRCTILNKLTMFWNQALPTHQPWTVLWSWPGVNFLLVKIHFCVFFFLKFIQDCGRTLLELFHWNKLRS